VSRRLRPDTRLARLILKSGKPAYVVAGEVGINYNRLLDYADARMDITPVHRIKLTRYFGTDPCRYGDNEEPGPERRFGGARFEAVVTGARVTPGGDAVVTLHVGSVGSNVREAWRLTDAAGIVLDVVGIGWFDDVPIAFSASVDDVRVRPAGGLAIRLRLPSDERDAALNIGRTSTPTRLIMTPAFEGARSGEGAQPS
jgi:hypothetical protein